MLLLSAVSMSSDRIGALDRQHCLAPIICLAQDDIRPDDLRSRRNHRLATLQLYRISPAIPSLKWGREVYEEIPEISHECKTGGIAFLGEAVACEHQAVADE